MCVCVCVYLVLVNGKRKQGRQITRWRDEISSFAGVTWNRQASDRVEWRRLGEALVLQWIHRGWWWWWVYRAWATVLFCLRICICPVFPFVNVHSLLLSPLLSVYSNIYISLRKAVLLLCCSGKFLIVIFSCVPLNIQPLLFFSILGLLYIFPPGCSYVCLCVND